MSSIRNELKENFTPKEQRKNTAQTTLPREIIQKFANRRSDWEGFKQFTFHVSLILFSQYLICYTTPNNNYYYLKYFLFYIPSQIFCGYTISFLFMGVHETVHHTAFKTPIYNDIVGYIFGFSCFRPPMHYRYYHWAHHRFTGNKSKDPELYSTWIDFDIADSLVNYIAYMSGIPFWIDRITCLLRHSTLFILENIFGCKLNSTVQNFLLPKELEYYLQTKMRRYNVSLESLLFIVLYLLILIFFDVGLLWKYWYLPSLIGQIFLRGYLIAEHRNCKNNTNMFSNSRTTKTFWLEYKLAWMMPWHIEHHSFPYVPFYLLKELHELLVENLGDEQEFYGKSECKPNGSDGYFSVHKQILDDIFNKQK
eukprot:208540_1